MAYVRGEDRQVLIEYLLLAMIVFYAAHGLVFSVPIFNVDDWAQVSYAEKGLGWSRQGRFGQNLLYYQVLAGSFSHTFQAVGAFFSFWLVPIFLLDKKERSLISLTLLFAIGVCYPLWVDALNFSAHVLAFPLTLLLSVVSFSLVSNPDDLKKTRSVLWRTILGGFLLFLSVSIYQPIAAFGVIVPFLVLMRGGRFNFLGADKVLVSSFFVLFIGVLSYLVSCYYYFFKLHPDITPVKRVGLGSVDIFVDKIFQFPERFIYTLSGGSIGGTFHLFGKTQISALFILFLLFLSVLIFLSFEKRFVDIFRLVLFSLLAIVAPVFGSWFIVDAPWYPPRALAAFNFSLGSVIFVLLGEWSALYRRRGNLKVEKVVKNILFAFLGIAVCTSAVADSKLWTNQWRVFQRDVALATSIFDAYASMTIHKTEDLPNLVLVGGSQYGDMYPDPGVTASVERSAFNASWSRRRIFEELFKGRVNKVVVRTVDEVTRNCEPFPAKNSLYFEDDQVVVCLDRVDKTE